jgi:hypothetical protein
MFDKLKLRLKAWADGVQQREIARLRQESQQLREQIERETGRPVELTSEERTRLAEIAKGMDSNLLRENATLDPEGLTPADIKQDSTEKE